MNIVNLILDKNAQMDKKTVIKAVKKDGNCILYVDELLRKDREVVLEAVKQNGIVLIGLDKKFSNDREIVLHAVESAGFVLENLPNKFRNDIEIVLKAVKYNYNSFKFAGKKIKKNIDICKEIIKIDPKAFAFFNLEIKNNLDLGLMMVEEKPHLFYLLGKNLKKNREVFIKAVTAYKNQPEKLRINNFSFLSCAGDEINNDRNLVFDLIKHKPDEIEYTRFFRDDKEINYWVMSHYPTYSQRISHEIFSYIKSKNKFSQDEFNWARTARDLLEEIYAQREVCVLQHHINDRGILKRNIL